MIDVSFFAEMAWKSALISGAALMLAFTLRSRSASDRALVLRLGVALLLLMPLIALWMPALEIVAFAAPEAAQASFAFPAPELQLAALAGELAPAPEPTIWDDPTPLVLLAYLGGLAMVGSRLLGGLWLLNRWTRAAREVTCPEWLAAFDRVRWVVPNDEAVRLLVSDEVGSPLSWGWRRPVILIDPDTLDQTDDAEAILAHEAAHIARRDWLALMLSRIAATLFWFNPLVWMLEREVVQHSEEAADCEAAERVEPVRYAETLLNWARIDPHVPANGIAPATSALGRRVRAILDRARRERQSGSAWTAFAMLACIGIAGPVAAAQLVAAQPPEAPEPPQAPAAPVAPEAPMPPAPPRAPRVIHADEDIVVIVPRGHTLVHARAADAALAAVLPQIPGIVASATAAIDPEEIEEALREAEVELREMPEVSEAQVRAALDASRAARSQVRVIRRDHIQHALRASQRARAAAPRVMRVSLAHSADGMVRGAAGMESGAERMERQAAQLEDRDYRERKIAAARARGETVTHEELIEAAEGLREGAEGMREGAREMREAAERMRERHD